MIVTIVADDSELKLTDIDEELLSIDILREEYSQYQRDSIVHCNNL